MLSFIEILLKIGLGIVERSLPLKSKLVLSVIIDYVQFLIWVVSNWYQSGVVPGTMATKKVEDLEEKMVSEIGGSKTDYKAFI